MKIKLENLVKLHNNPKKVIDVGGYKGDYAYEVNKRFNCEVFVFEPIEEFFKVCEKKFRDNPKIEVIKLGLNNSIGRVNFYKNDVASSMFNGWAKTTKTENVEVDKLSKYMTHNIDIVKLNCEGCEYGILSDLLETGWLNKIPEILVQWHRIKPFRGVGRNLKIELLKTHKLVYNDKWSLYQKI